MQYVSAGLKHQSPVMPPLRRPPWRELMAICASADNLRLWDFVRLPASVPGSVATMRGRSADARPPPEDARARVQEAARGPNLASTSRSAGSGGEGGEVPNAVSAGGVRWGEGGGASVEATPAVSGSEERE